MSKVQSFLDKTSLQPPPPPPKPAVYGTNTFFHIYNMEENLSHAACVFLTFACQLHDSCNFRKLRFLILLFFVAVYSKCSVECVSNSLFSKRLLTTKMKDFLKCILNKVWGRKIAGCGSRGSCLAYFWCVLTKFACGKYPRVSLVCKIFCLPDEHFITVFWQKKSKLSWYLLDSDCS